MERGMSNPNFCRGASPTPRSRLCGISAFRPLPMAIPDQFAIYPKRLSNWGNDQHGDCVTAEECYAKSAYSVRCGLPQTFITRDQCISWARSHGVLNGAYLPNVMDMMARDGITAEDSQNYKDGPYKSLDIADEQRIREAIIVGPVKLGIAANGLPSGAGSHQGWFSTSGTHHGNEDHSVTLDGYGRADFIYDALGVSLPSGLAPSTVGFGLFTWGTIGFVNHDWLRGSCQEAFVRNPTTLGQTPEPPQPPSTPPYKLYEGSMSGEMVQVGGTEGYADLALARLTAQSIADADKKSVMIHDSTGKMVDTMNPTPPAPVKVPFSLTIPGVQCVRDGFGSFHTPSQNVNGMIELPPLAGAGFPSLPPWLMMALRLACKAAPTLPAPYNAIVGGLCQLLPQSSEQDCPCNQSSSVVDEACPPSPSSFTISN